MPPLRRLSLASRLPQAAQSRRRQWRKALRLNRRCRLRRSLGRGGREAGSRDRRRAAYKRLASTMKRSGQRALRARHRRRLSRSHAPHARRARRSG
eukprot:398139-Pleurochrysis_carterae.AAC.1